MVAHPGAGLNACVCNLYRAVQPLRAPRRKRVDHDNKVRLRLFDNPLYDLRRFHSCLCHDARLQCADQIHFFTVVCRLAILLYHMSRDKQVIHHLRTERVRRHLPVAKPDYKNRTLRSSARQHIRQLLCKAIGYFAVVILIRLYNGGRFHRHINPHGLPHRLCGVFGVDHHLCDPHFFLIPVVFLHSDSPQFAFRLTDAFPRLQCQICPHLKIRHFSFQSEAIFPHANSPFPLCFQAGLRRFGTNPRLKGGTICEFSFMQLVFAFFPFFYAKAIDKPITIY